MEPGLDWADTEFQYSLFPVNLELIKNLWLPNIFIYNLKSFKTIDVLSKLAGLWIDSKKRIYYSQATHITFICPMRFDKFPLDTQTCKFRVGSYSYDSSKLLFITKNAGKTLKMQRCIVQYRCQIEMQCFNFRLFIWGDKQYCA